MRGDPRPTAPYREHQEAWRRRSRRRRCRASHRGRTGDCCRCAPRNPVDDPLFAGRIDRRRIGGRDGEPRHARAVGDLRLEGVHEEALPILGEARVEGEAEEVIEPCDRPQITDEVGVGHLFIPIASGSRPQRERINLPLLFGDHHPIASGDRHEPPSACRSGAAGRTGSWP